MRANNRLFIIFFLFISFFLSLILSFLLFPTKQANKTKNIVKIPLNLVWPLTPSQGRQGGEGGGKEGKGEPKEIVEVIVPSVRLILSNFGETNGQALYNSLLSAVTKYLSNEGEEKGRKREGRWVYPNGGVYEGGWEEGSPSGGGKFSFLGNTYVGGWGGGVAEGEGICRFFTGDVLKGEWKGGYVEGGGKEKEGVLYCSTGDIFEGGFGGGEKSGRGVWRSRGGRIVVEGEFLEGRGEGRWKGVYKWGGVEVCYEGQVFFFFFFWFK